MSDYFFFVIINGYSFLFNRLLLNYNNLNTEKNDFIFHRNYPDGMCHRMSIQMEVDRSRYVRIDQASNPMDMLKYV